MERQYTCMLHYHRLQVFVFHHIETENSEAGRDKYLERLIQQVHLSELVSFGEIQLGSHGQISEILLQGPVQSPQSLAHT